MEQIATASLAINSPGIFEKVTTQRMKLTQHDCYKSVADHVHEKCFDLQVCSFIILSHDH